MNLTEEQHAIREDREIALREFYYKQYAAWVIALQVQHLVGDPLRASARLFHHRHGVTQGSWMSCVQPPPPYKVVHSVFADNNHILVRLPLDGQVPHNPKDFAEQCGLWYSTAPTCVQHGRDYRHEDTDMLFSLQHNLSKRCRVGGGGISMPHCREFGIRKYMEYLRVTGRKSRLRLLDTKCFFVKEDADITTLGGLGRSNTDLTKLFWRK